MQTIRRAARTAADTTHFLALVAAKLVQLAWLRLALFIGRRGR